MRKSIFTGVRIAAVSVLLLAQAHAESLPIGGTVTKIDTAAGKITLRHGPITKLDMDEGMTMVFRARNPELLTRVKVGDRVKFDAEKVNGQLTVTGIEKAK